MRPLPHPQPPPPTLLAPPPPSSHALSLVSTLRTLCVKNKPNPDPNLGLKGNREDTGGILHVPPSLFPPQPLPLALKSLRARQQVTH